jgi:hypothetical protein
MQRQLSTGKIWHTRRKEVVKVELWYRRWKGKRDNRMSNRDVSVVSVMDLNIRGWRGPAAPARGIRIQSAHARRSWGQFHSNILVLDVRVQCFVLFQSLVGGSGNLDGR